MSEQTNSSQLNTGREPDTGVGEGKNERAKREDLGGEGGRQTSKQANEQGGADNACRRKSNRGKLHGRGKIEAGGYTHDGGPCKRQWPEISQVGTAT